MVIKHLRQYIRQILLEDARSMYDATRYLTKYKNEKRIELLFRAPIKNFPLEAQESVEKIRDFAKETNTDIDKMIEQATVFGFLDQFKEATGYYPAYNFAELFIDSSRSTRALGLQTDDEIQVEKEFLRQYKKHADIKSFMSDELTIFHKIGYHGYATGMRQKDVGTENLGSWIQQHGTSGKDVLSTVGIAQNIYDINLNQLALPDNAADIFKQPPSVGFVMKGYPVLVSKKDVMSQTLGAVPQSVVKKQKQSGVAKRGFENQWDLWYSLEEMQQGTKVAQEILLDNWKIDGAFVVVEPPWNDHREEGDRNDIDEDEWTDSDWTLEDAQDFKNKHPNIPVYIFYASEGFTEEW